jgi:hypothetical protein
MNILSFSRDMLIVLLNVELRVPDFYRAVDTGAVEKKRRGDVEANKCLISSLSEYVVNLSYVLYSPPIPTGGWTHLWTRVSAMWPDGV